jgi:sulfoxide reductase heme-binding subunit YedZ
MSASQDPIGHAWWLASRSAGVVAYLLLSASVILGLAMATRVAPTRFRPALRTTHERVALLALASIGAHGLFLLPDSFIHMGLSGLLVPFAGPYRPFWTGLGVLGGYMAAALSLTYYVRKRVGPRRWRKAHRLIPIAWAMSVVHVLGSGSDVGSTWLALPIAITVASVLGLLGYRVLGRRGSHAPAGPPQRSRAGAPA